jgi:hypothetical protein
MQTTVKLLLLRLSLSATTTTCWKLVEKSEVSWVWYGRYGMVQYTSLALAVQYGIVPADRASMVSFLVDSVIDVSCRHLFEEVVT